MSDISYIVNAFFKVVPVAVIVCAIPASAALLAYLLLSKKADKDFDEIWSRESDDLDDMDYR